MNTLDSIMTHYDENISTYSELKSKIELLIKDILKYNSIDVHSVNGRVKERKSLIDKINLKNKYKSIHDITDVVGFRIITNLENEIDEVANSIADEFIVDPDNSHDKRINSNLSEFGYASLHYVVTIDEKREDMIEYKTFKSIKFEIQIRSILQHAWAELQHNSAYKSEFDLPNEAKRDFALIAAIIESTDKSLSRLKEYLADYQSKILKDMSSKPETIDINAISLRTYCDESQVFDYIKQEIGKASGGNISFKKDDIIERFSVERLNKSGFDSILNLNSALEARKDQIVKYYIAYLNNINEFIDRPIEISESGIFSRLAELSTIEIGKHVLLDYMLYLRYPNVDIAYKASVEAYKTTNGE